VLDGDQPVGVLALGVERVGGHHGGGEVQALQERVGCRNSFMQLVGARA
jgi:hypothetical protein